MPEREAALIVCEVLSDEIAGRVPADVDVHVIAMGLHDYPKKLHQELQETINTLEQEHCYQVIILGFGLCSEGVVGLQARRAKLVVPRADDCIALFLGSMESYREQFKRAPGTYYYTKKNIDKDCGPLAMFLGRHEWTRNYDSETAQWIACEMIRHYTRIVLIDTGTDGLAPYEEHARQAAAVFKIQFEMLPGTLSLLDQLLHGPWDNQFVKVEAGKKISRGMF